MHRPGPGQLRPCMGAGPAVLSCVVGGIEGTRRAMWTTIIVVLLGVALVVLLILIFKKKKSRDLAPPPVEDLANIRITDARVGDVISIHGAGENYDDLQFTVDSRNRYQYGDESSFELVGRYRGRKVFVECYEDDELEVTANLDGSEIRFQDLNLVEQDLIRFDEEQNPAKGIDFGGEHWSFEESHEIGFFRDGQGDGEGFYSWQFVSDDGRREFCVEKWEGEGFQALIVQRIDPDDCRVFRA